MSNLPIKIVMNQEHASFLNLSTLEGFITEQSFKVHTPIGTRTIHVVDFESHPKRFLIVFDI